MRDFLILFVHLVVTLARLARPGGVRSVVAESALVRHQLLVLNRGRKRAPTCAADRIIAGLCTLFMRRARVLRAAIALKPSTLLHLHSVLRKRKYRMLFSPVRGRRPGPKGPNKARRRCHETAQSHLGLSPHRSADRPGLRSGSPIGFYGLVPGFVSSFLAGVASAWVLLVEIVR
jgi:hypothetical protein